MAQPVMEPTRERAPLRPADPNVVPLVRPARKRPSWVLLGVVLVGAAALLGAVVFSSSTSQISIVVAARDLAPGEVIAATDLRVVEIGSTGEMRAIQSSQQSLVIGQAARGPIPAGTVLNTDLFVEAGTAVPAGFVVVGSQLEPGAAPRAALATGDAVDVIGVGRGGLGVIVAARCPLAIAGVANRLGVARRHVIVGHVVVYVLPLVIHSGVFGGFQRAVIGRVAVPFQRVGRSHLAALLTGRQGVVLVCPAGRQQQYTHDQQ